MANNLERYCCVGVSISIIIVVRGAAAHNKCEFPCYIIRRRYRYSVVEHIHDRRPVKSAHERPENITRRVVRRGKNYFFFFFQLYTRSLYTRERNVSLHGVTHTHTHMCVHRRGRDEWIDY